MKKEKQEWQTIWSPCIIFFFFYLSPLLLYVLIPNRLWKLEPCRQKSCKIERSQLRLISLVELGHLIREIPQKGQMELTTVQEKHSPMQLFQESKDQRPKYQVGSSIKESGNVPKETNNWLNIDINTVWSCYCKLFKCSPLVPTFLDRFGSCFFVQCHLVLNEKVCVHKQIVYSEHGVWFSIAR